MPIATGNDLEKILNILELDILSGFYKPRERLIEKELSKRFKTSRGTIRKILQELESRHLIQHFPNRGALVAEPTKKEMEDIYNTRVLLESYAIDLVFQNLDHLSFDRVERHRVAFEKAYENSNLKGFLIANKQFHQTIFQACGNNIILKIIDTLRKRSHIWQHYIVGQSDRLKKSLQEHEEMVSCLRKKKVAKLKKVNKRHLTHGYKSYMADLMQ